MDTPDSPTTHETLDFEDEAVVGSSGAPSPKQTSSDDGELSDDDNNVGSEEEDNNGVTSPPRTSEKPRNDAEEDGELEDSSSDNDDDKDGPEDGEFKEPINKDSHEAACDSVEEGEVTDEEVISEIDRKDNKPICRFFNKGTCTWGNNCRLVDNS